MEEIKVPKDKSQPEPGEPVVKPLESSSPFAKLNFSRNTILALVGVCLLGIVTGYGLYAKQNSGTVRLAGRNVQIVSTPTEEGVKDASTFRDTATGTLIENDGKITSEGSHILVRDPKDPSQNAYLTSSVIDLSKYVGKKVQVWGETFKGQKAGWLMDVGRIKLL